MARPFKKGIDYFPIEVDMDEDDKFFDLFDHFGTDKGVGIIILLLSYLYKNDGYYTKWNDSICRKFSRKKHIDKEDIQEAINILTGTSKLFTEADQDELFFSKNMYKTESILTSKAIQKRFFVAADRRKERPIYKQYLLLNYDKAEIQVGSKREQGIYVPILEDSYFVTIDKKKIPFDFIISGQLEDNANINEDNVYNNSVNVNASTHTKLNQTKSNGEQTEIKLNQTEIKLKEKEKESNIIEISNSAFSKSQPFDTWTGEKKDYGRGKSVMDDVKKLSDSKKVKGE